MELVRLKYVCLRESTRFLYIFQCTNRILYLIIYFHGKSFLTLVIVAYSLTRRPASTPPNSEVSFRDTLTEKYNTECKVYVFLKISIDRRVTVSKAVTVSIDERSKLEYFICTKETVCLIKGHIQEEF